MIRNPIIPIAGLLFGLALAAMPARGAEERNSEVDVAVNVDGENVRVTATFTVAASPQEAWAVLTDFENMARFVSNLELSEVLLRQGNTIRVHARGKARFGPITFPFESVRELTLKPFERIQSRQVSGTLRSFEGETLLTATTQGTRISYRGNSISNQSIPPVFGPAFIKSETEEQFHELQTEILRRRIENGRRNAK